MAYNANGGSSTPAVETDVTTVTLPNVSRTGYTFAGWYNGNTRVGGAGDKWTPTADATLTAKWTPVTYSISYVLNGGSNNSGNPSSYNIETATITLKDPTRTGYTFAGWHSDSGLTSRVTTINKGSTGNKTFYAKWTPRTDTKYVVKHQLMNVSGSGYTLKDTENLKGTTDTNVTPARKSYTGFTAPAAQTATINADGSRVFTYSYSRNKYTATFNGNGGTSSMTSASIYYESTLGTLPTATRTGYNFKGWYTAASGGTQITSSTKLMGNTTYYAQWTPITYTITYKLNGGKVDYKKVKYNIETPTFYIENPTKKGYNFTGWTGTGISTATTDLSVPLGSYGNKTFEATWGNGVYAISFDGNGATSGSMETINVKAGESVKLPENGFIRDGYCFVGWYTTKQDRFGTFYRNGATITDLTESVTLHAQWKKEKTPSTPGDNGNNGTDTGNGGSGSTGDNGDNGNGSSNGSGTGTGENGGNTSSGEGGNGTGNGGNGSTGDSGNGDKPSTGDNNGDNTGSGSTGDNGSGRGNDNGHNKQTETSKDEIGYFGTGKRTNEISILTTLGMNDKKLTLNYNY